MMHPENDAAIKPVPPSSVLGDVRCWCWCALLIFGFAYVSMRLCERALPFASGNNSWGDWLAVLLSAPTLYGLAVRHTLGEHGAKTSRVMLWKGLVYVGLFFGALHWERVGPLLHAHISLTSDHLAHLDGPSKIALALILVLFLSMSGVCLWEARREQIFLPYLVSFAVLVAVLAAVTCALGPGYHLHIHHYFLALCLLPFVRFRHPACLVTQAILAGVYVEGASRWGLDPIWVAGR